MRFISLQIFWREKVFVVGCRRIHGDNADIGYVAKRIFILFWEIRGKKLKNNLCLYLKNINWK